ncbi:MAG: dihydrolipoyl dehydrogenase, partial [bacterium]
MKKEKAQLVVLGGGPGGYVAAFHAADLGMDVTLVDQEPRPGGVCLFRGCIPSKALLQARKLMVEAKNAGHMGLRFSDTELDIDKLRDWKNGVIEKLTKGLMSLAKARKVKFIQARGAFTDSNTIQLSKVEGGDEDPPEAIEFEKCILAAGSVSSMPKMFQVDDDRVMGSRQALNLPDIPKRLLVVGGGYIGLELGQVYQGFGSKVTVVEMMDQLLPATDADLVKPLARQIKKDFENVYLKTTVEKIEPQKKGVKVHFKAADDKKFDETFDRILVSVGRRPNSDKLGLDNTKAKLNDRGFVQVNARMETDDPAILAIGDIVGGMMLAHKAFYEGKVAAAVASGDEYALNDTRAIPAVVFSDPEIAYCGLTENQAKEQNVEVQVARYPWAANGRALILGQSTGMSKIICDPETHRVLGMGMVGHGSEDLVAEAVLAVEMAATAEDVAAAIHAHP